MKRWKIASSIRRLRQDESGAVIVLVAIAIVALIGFAALAIDVGNLVYAQRRLQATTDSAAYAGAAAGPYGTAVSTAQTYSALSGQLNHQPGLNVTSESAAVTCLTSTGLACTNPTAYPPNGANAIIVQQQATVPFTLGQVFGFGSVTLSATSLASFKGSSLPPMHIMIVLDNTRSMNDTDPTGTTCGGINDATRIQCALAGVQTMLAELWPTQDEVGLIVFPPVETSTAGNDTNCSSSAEITPEAYSDFPATATYQIVSLTNSYRSSNTSTSLTSPGTTSTLINATCQAGLSIDQNGVTSNCGSCTGDKVVGGEGTYLAGAITAAQSTLAAESVAGVQNVIIVLSDGGAGNAANLWSDTTTQATLPGGTTLTMATSIPAYVIPGTSVADNTTQSAIPAGTQVVSTSGSTVVLSNAVTAAATDTTNAATPPGNSTLHFASVPAAVTSGLTVNDQTHSSAIAACTTVASTTATTVTLSNAVTGTTAATDNTNAATPAGQTILYFASVPAQVAVGMGVADTTTSSAIPSGSTVVSFTATTVTISNPVGVTVTDTTNASATNSTTLHFNSVPSTVQSGMAVTGTGIPASTTVVSTTSNTVVISQRATVANNTTITFSGDSVAKGDTITFSSDVASGDTITFGGVGCGDTIGFGANNQCHESITAAQDAAKAGTWVYSIAYGSSTALSPNSNSCSDTETPQISSCTTMQDIANSPGAIPDPTKFYSDPMGGSCTSTDNPTATDIATIFADIGYSFEYTILLSLSMENPP